MRSWPVSLQLIWYDQANDSGESNDFSRITNDYLSGISISSIVITTTYISAVDQVKQRYKHGSAMLAPEIYIARIVHKSTRDGAGSRNYCNSFILFNSVSNTSDIDIGLEIRTKLLRIAGKSLVQTFNSCVMLTHEYWAWEFGMPTPTSVVRPKLSSYVLCHMERSSLYHND